MNLRENARGRDCCVRLPGCDGGGETSCLAHYSLAGVSGRGYKSPDICGAYCCALCHSACDGQRVVAGYGRTDLRLALAEGVIRTLAQLDAEGWKLVKT